MQNKLENINLTSQIKAVFFRFGRMIVVMDDQRILPKLFQLTRAGWKEISKIWKVMETDNVMKINNFVSPNTNQSANSNEALKNNDSAKDLKDSDHRLAGAVLLWDPKNKSDVLVTLNDSCQLNFLSANINLDKNERISFRVMQE